MSKIYDVVIIGGGPAGLTTALYTAREQLSTVVIEKGVIGGLMATIDKIDNYPGSLGASGGELAGQFRDQAEKFGVEFENSEVLKCCKKSNVVKITTNNGEISAKTMVIATGNSYRKIDIPGGERAHYCVTCDGPFYKDKNLAIVGGGNSAIQGAIFLSKFAKHIDLIVRGEISATKVLLNDLKQYKNKVKIHSNTEPKAVLFEDKKITGLELSNSKTLSIDGFFALIGSVPNSDMFKDLSIELDDEGYIITDKDLATNIDGVFAAGDIRSGNFKQISVAVGEGATVAHSIRAYLEKGV